MTEGNGQLVNAINSSETLSAFTANIGQSYGGATGTMTTTPYNTGYSHFYYSCPYGCNHNESKTEKAYQVIRALMKAKLVRLNTLPKFFELMDELTKVL
jgi:hypothetical protein